MASSESASKADETIEEIRFYLAHGMPEQAMAALAKLQTLTGDHAKLAELRAEIEAASQSRMEEEAAVAVEPVVDEVTADDLPTVEVEVEEAPARRQSPQPKRFPMVDRSLPGSEPAASEPVGSQKPHPSPNLHAELP